MLGLYKSEIRDQFMVLVFAEKGSLLNFLRDLNNIIEIDAKIRMYVYFYIYLYSPALKLSRYNLGITISRREEYCTQRYRSTKYPSRQFRKRSDI
jgi:hypothetical protein